MDTLVETSATTPNLIEVKLDNSGVFFIEPSQERQQLDAEKFQDRVRKFNEDLTFPFIPSQTFTLQGFTELEIEHNDILDESYLDNRRLHRGNLGDLIVGNGSMPFYLKCIKGLFGERNFMIFDPQMLQNRLSQCSLYMGSFLASKGVIVGFNGIGGNNSSNSSHLQVYDTRGTQIRPRGDVYDFAYDIDEAPEAYKSFLEQGRVVGAIMLQHPGIGINVGHRKIAFLEHLMPQIEGLAEGDATSLPYHLNAEILKNNPYLMKFFYLKMLLGVGCFEAGTLTVVKKVKEWSVEDHFRAYKKLVVPSSANQKERPFINIYDPELMRLIEIIDFERNYGIEI